MDLEDLFHACHRDLYIYLLRLSGNPSDAEELAQDTFVRACGAALRFRGDSSPRTWLLGIARRVWLESIRKRRRDLLLTDYIGGADRIDEVVSERVDLLRAFESLSESDREVLTIVDVLGCTPSEAASIVELSPEALRVRLHRARARLRGVYLRA